MMLYYVRWLFCWLESIIKCFFQVVLCYFVTSDGMFDSAVELCWVVVFC